MPLGHESSISLIGIGNEFRRDDAAGLFAVRRIQEKKIPGVQIIEHQGDGTALMERWQGFGNVFIFDAASSGAGPGTVHRFEIPPDRIPRDLWGCSTHTLNIADTLELAGALRRLPKRIILYGIEGASFEKGNGVSAQVEKAIRKVVAEVVSEILSVHCAGGRQDA